MVDLEPFLEAPFEEAPNRSFELLLGLGVVLLAVVAVLGRSTVTQAIVALYLLSIPAYVGYRIRTWERDDANDGDEDGDPSNGGGSNADSSGDEANDDAAAEADA